MEVMNTTSTVDPSFYYNYFNNIMSNPIILIIIAVVIVGFVIFTYSLGSNESTSEDFLPDSDNSKSYFSKGSNIFIIIIVVVLVILILVNAFQYFFSINVSAYVKNLFKPNAELDVVVNQQQPLTEPEPEPLPEIDFRKQVFNIPGNYYNYDNAKALCSAYGATLANYSQIENAYNNGAEWCNYGWSDGQMALFPTQQSTYNELQKIPKHKNDCGRPGINGGYMANTQLQFGVNCYGDKPRITQEENEIMDTATRYPQNNEDLLFDKEVDYWKNQIDNILVSPFNKNQWSEI